MTSKWICLVALFAFVAGGKQSLQCDEADWCTEDCKLPECSCFEDQTDVPDNKARPQIVYLTYDDAFTAQAEQNYYSHIFNTYKNPDGNFVRATHFVSAQYTDYTLVHKYWAKGHEIASHSITHRSVSEYWKNLDADGWAAEAAGMKNMTSHFASIPKEDITGFRAPFLVMGGDEMIDALEANGFTYDCTWSSRGYGYLNMDNGLFPYTLDYMSYQECEIGHCPVCAHPGFWVQPMLDLEDEWIGADPYHPNNGIPCAMLDACVMPDPASDRNTVKNMLMKNFLRNRNGTRSPMGLYMHAAWFVTEFHFEGYKDFLAEVTDQSKYGDVWLVPVVDGLNYYANYHNWTNQDILDAGDASPFAPPHRTSAVNCKTSLDNKPCHYENVINDDIPAPGQDRYMHICDRDLNNHPLHCPPKYPWLNDPCGGRPCP